MRTPAIPFGLTVALALACGGSGAFRAGDPWNPEQARFFDDGVDFIDDMSKVSGGFASRQTEELDGLVQFADLVAEVEIKTVQTARDVNGAEQKRFEVEVVKILSGSAPSGSFTLCSCAESPGYTMIARFEDRLSGRYLAFVRWFEGEDGQLLHHFHLSPASDAIRAEVMARLGRMKKRPVSAQDAGTPVVEQEAGDQSR